MKTLIVILVYFLTFFGLFLTFSLAGTIWTSYLDTIMDQGWFMSYLLFLGWWMAGLVAYEVYGQLFKSNKNDTETDLDFIDDSINKKIPFEEAQKCLAFYERIDQIKCPYCDKEAKELDWFEFKSSSATWNNLAGRAGYYCY